MIIKFQSSKLMSAFQSVEEYIADRDGERKKFFIMDIKEARARRTLSQNAYWFVICSQIALKLQISKQDVHKMLALEFFGKIIKLPNGGMKFIPRETKEFTTLEFTQLIEKGRAWAAMELGLDILSPEEWTEENRIRLLNEYEKSQTL